MILIILMSLIVMIIGKIKLLPRLALYGRPARLYGATLLLVAFPAQILLANLAAQFPQDLIQNDIILTVLNVICVFLILSITMLPFIKMKSEVSRPESKRSFSVWTNRKYISLYLLLSGSMASLLTYLMVVKLRQPPSSELDGSFMIMGILNGFFGLTFFLALYLLLRSLIVNSKTAQ